MQVTGIFERLDWIRAGVLKNYSVGVASRGMQISAGEDIRTARDQRSV